LHNQILLYSDSAKKARASLFPNCVFKGKMLAFRKALLFMLLVASFLDTIKSCTETKTTYLGACRAFAISGGATKGTSTVKGKTPPIRKTKRVSPTTAADAKKKAKEKDCDDDDDEEDDDELEEEKSHNKKQNRTAKKKRTKKSHSYLSMGLESASDLANMAMRLTKGSVKAAVDLAANKHVTLNQIVGKWRLQQEIEVRKGVFISCPATLEFLEDGTVVTTCDGQEFKSEFVFKERTWPRKCTISFQARAFQGPGDSEPVAMFYKGYFKRSILNSKVILIRGKVYKLSGQMFFKQQVKTGKFKATKRRYR